MSCFDQDQAALAAKRLVLAQVWTAQPCALWVVAVLVRESAFHNEDFLAAVMPMGIEVSAWRPTHHGRMLGAEFP